MPDPIPVHDESRRPCGRCGHVREWHRTKDGACTGEILRFPADTPDDGKTGKRGRCDCPGFLMRRPA